MLREVTRAAALGMLAAVIGLSAVQAERGQKDPSLSSGWVRLPAPGAATTEAFVVVENPTMYDFYLLSASSDVAGSVELRETGKDAALDEVTVPAYGSLDMSPKGVHLLLKGLKKPLNEGDKVSLTLVTEAGLKLQTDALVRKQP